MKYQSDHGLLVDCSTTPPTCAGYLFRFEGHGAFDPNGNLGDLSKDEVDTHNRLLAEALWQALLKHGHGTLYVHRTTEQGKPTIQVSDWPGVHRLEPYHVRHGRHNMAGKRLDVWFNLDGSEWHGVNIGDNDMLWVRRKKG